MKVANKEQFEKENIFGMGMPNNAYAKYYRRFIFKSAYKAR